jgi:hypothetical protein
VKCGPEVTVRLHCRLAVSEPHETFALARCELDAALTALIGAQSNNFVAFHTEYPFDSRHSSAAGLGVDDSQANPATALVRPLSTFPIPTPAIQVMVLRFSPAYQIK